MGILVFLAKPILYVLAMVIASKRFAPFRASERPARWAVVLLGAVLRMALGGLGGVLLWALAESPAAVLIPLLVALGATWWFLTLWVWFRKAPSSRLLVFVLVAEAVTAAIDVWAFVSLSSIRMC